MDPLHHRITVRAYKPGRWVWSCRRPGYNPCCVELFWFHTAERAADVGREHWQWYHARTYATT